MDSDDEIECLGTISAINSISNYRETQHLKYQQQTNDGLICPSHYDPEVFNNLPLDLQQFKLSITIRNYQKESQALFETNMHTCI